MRIGFDYTAAVRQGAGIGRYTRQLFQALIELDTRNEYVLLIAGRGVGLSGERPEPGRGLGYAPELGEIATRPNVRVVTVPLSDRALMILWHRLRVPLWVELFCGSLDLFHSPDFTLPPVRRASGVLTVHDLSFIRVPHSAHPQLRAYLLQAVPRSVQRADWVLADSECTKRDLIELLGATTDSVKVIYPGVERRFRPVREAALRAVVRERYQLPPRFVLALSTLQPRKNFERLIRAFARLPESVRQEVKLVIAGGRGWRYEGIFETVSALQMEDAVCFPGYVADQDLPALYSLAELFALPSLYEGFGLEPLEAMACGTPVVTSNVSSLPEVVGDAAISVDPLDVDGLAEALELVLSDPALQQDMIRKGIDRARRFTWEAAAHKLLRLYERAVAA
jgi:glycosyltransferase involved in cell wall biosynthesis